MCNWTLDGENFGFPTGHEGMAFGSELEARHCVSLNFCFGAQGNGPRVIAGVPRYGSMKGRLDRCRSGAFYSRGGQLPVGFCSSV